jgi:hypothetical protein
MRSTREVTFLEAHRGQHALCDRDVFRLPAVRGTRQRELIVAPMEIVEAAGLQERHDLEWLGTGSPMGQAPRLASAGGETIACVDDRRMDAVAGLHDPSSRRDDVELVRPHGRLAASGALTGFTLET